MAISSFFKQSPVQSQDPLVLLEAKKFSYREKEDDPHTQAMEGQIEVIKGFPLSRKLTFLDVITKIQKLVDQNQYSFGQREGLIRDLLAAYTISYQVYMEDPVTGKESWTPVSTEKVSEVFVDQIAHFARSKPKTFRRSTYAGSIEKILSEIDSLFTPQRLKLWNRLLEGESNLAVRPVLAKALKNEMAKAACDDLFALLAMWLTRGGDLEELSLIGLDIHTRSQHQETALMWASRVGRLDAVRLFLAAGADVNSEDEDRCTALIYASLHGHLEIVQELIPAGADVNRATVLGCTALIYACKGGHIAVVRELLLADAQINAPNKRGGTPLMVAVGQEEKEMLEMAEMLLLQGADIHRTDDHRRTALHWASIKGHSNIVRLLLANGAEVDAQDQGGYTALLWAAQKGKEEVAKELVKAKANVNAKSVAGATPLSLAVRYGTQATASFLLSQGADSAPLLFPGKWTRFS